MTRALEIHVNRSDHHDVETRTKRFAPDGPFEVHVRNHGEGLHVHLAVTGDLVLESASFDGNPYLERESTLEVPVDVPTDLRPASGAVELSTGYGRNAVSVDVDVVGDDAGTGAGTADAVAGAGTVDSARAQSSAETGPEAATRRSTGGTSTGSTSTAGTPAGGSAADARDESVLAGATGAFAGFARAVAAFTDGASAAVRRASRALSSDSDTENGADSEQTSRSPSVDAGTVLLAALALLAICAAGAALATISGPAVAVGVLAVVVTVVGVGLSLLVL